MHHFDASAKNSSGVMPQGLHNIVWHRRHLLHTPWPLAPHFTPGTFRCCVPFSCAQHPASHHPNHNTHADFTANVVSRPSLTRGRHQQGGPDQPREADRQNAHTKESGVQDNCDGSKRGRSSSSSSSNSTTLGAVLLAVVSLQLQRFSRNPFSRWKRTTPQRVTQK